MRRASGHCEVSDAPSAEERLRTNYNETGVAVMQVLYSDDYLSIGGVESTDALAATAGVTSASTVLDIGCGVGGPALHLAQTIGCRVVGIDLVETSIAEALRRAETRDLAALASFEVAEATALPFEDASFDFVVGQDAWCHIPDKETLVAEIVRVLRPNGKIAFTDWLAGTGMSGAERAAALDAALSRNAISLGQYESLLAEAGLADIDGTDISATFVTQYQLIYDRLRLRRKEIVEQFGERVYAIVADINGTILRGFEGGAIEGGRFLATGPS